VRAPCFGTRATDVKKPCTRNVAVSGRISVATTARRTNRTARDQNFARIRLARDVK
jgi:hypothetical protein